jgi:hypothetical protein
VAFLSLLDDRAKPKGSRDPLGFEMVWTFFGRRVVGNLTTITSSLENFSVALLGFHWANELALNISEEDKPKKIRENFLKYEQIAAYLRYYENSKSIMGITRVTDRINNDAKLIYLGLGSNEQILSDQTGYGLWGFYSNALKDTDLIKGNERYLTEKGLSLASRFENNLNKDIFFNWINGNSVAKSELKSVSKKYMKAIHNEELVNDLFEKLMIGGEKEKIQEDLWYLTKSIAKNKHFPDSVEDFINAIKAHAKNNSALLDRLQEIEQVERVLVAINNIFNYCQRHDGTELSEVLTNIKKQSYNYDYLPSKLPEQKFPRRDYIERILQFLRKGDDESVLKEIFVLNKVVMEQRNGAPWIELENGKKLRVRVKNEKSSLLSQQDRQLETHWDYDYFLGAYLAIAKSRFGAAHG